MSEEARPSSRRTLLVSTLILLGFLLVSLSPLVPRVQGLTNPGATDPLVNPGQRTRDLSSAIPVIGFNMTATTPGEVLRSVTVSFSGSDWQAGNDRDLRALSSDGRNSGVAIYRDDGGVDDQLDAGDHAITMRSGPTWSGNDVIFDFAGSGTSEPIPLTVAGRYQWFIVIRTGSNAADLIDGETITVTIKANAIVASSGAGTTTQPLFTVATNPLTVDITSGYDIVGASGFPWIGPATALVNSKAVLGIHIVDGGIAVNRGIQDTITSIDFRVVELAGAISSGDFQPITTDPATSGIALYRDDGAQDDQWDPSDTGIIPASITPTTFPAGTTTFTMTFTSPGLDVPNAPIGNFDLFLVVRTKGIVTGDDFAMEIRPQAIHVHGILTSGVDTDLRLPRDTQSSGAVQADSTPPQTVPGTETWFTSSNYLYASGLELHFGHSMTTVQTAYAAGWAYDGESGLSNATFSPEPSLASSPPMQSLSGAFQLYFGAYGFSNTSLATSSPADVTIRDMVGNSISTSQEGRSYRYIYDTAKVIILPSPGWSTSGTTPPFWVDPATGKLWFSSLIPSPSTATIDLKVASLSGFELTTISASGEPTLGGPTPASTTFPAGTFNSAWSTSYTINSTATGANAPVTITAADNQGNTGSASFDYGLDTAGPAITILNPTRGSILRGNIVARASAVDDHTKVLYVQFMVDGKTYPGLFDGSNYTAPISTADFPDGLHRIEVQAWDMVGNQNTVGVDVTFSNAAAIPPAVGLVTPVGGSYIQGLYTVSASATDSTGVKTVSIELRRVSDNGLVYSAAMGFALASGLWQADLDTLGVADGRYTLTVTAVNTGGLSANATVQVQVDNHAPILVVASPSENAYISGTITLGATGSDAFLSGVAYSVDGGAWMPLGNALDTTALADGHHVIAVRASDLSGKSTTQDVDVTVDNTPPTAALSSLAPGQVLKGVYTFRVFAWDAVGIKAVTLALAGQTVSMAYNPQSGYWEYTLDTATLGDGSYAAQPTVTDLSGKTTTPPAIAFAVRNQPEPPTLEQSFKDALPIAYFGFLIFAFAVVVLLLRGWGRGGGPRPKAEEEPEVVLRAQPPSPPGPPPPGGQ